MPREERVTLRQMNTGIEALIGALAVVGTILLGLGLYRLRRFSDYFRLAAVTIFAGAAVSLFVSLSWFFVSEMPNAGRAVTKLTVLAGTLQFALQLGSGVFALLGARQAAASFPSALSPPSPTARLSDPSTTPDGTTRSV